jgi:putative aldouronate transport system permease protein
MKLKKMFSPKQILLNVFLILISLTMIVPLLNILAISLSSPEASVSMSGVRIIPNDFDLINYKIVFNHPVLMRSVFNSIFITVIGTLINISFTSLAAYALTRPKLTLKKPLMVFLIFMMLFDPGLVPEYLVVQSLGLMGSRWSVILITCVNVYYLVIMMRYFEAVPKDIIEAGTLDGLSHVGMLMKIIIPLSSAGIATITMFYSVIRWNEYFKASIYILNQKYTVLQVILRQFVVLGDTVTLIGQQNVFNYNDLARIDYNALKAATIVVAIIPILVIYPVVLKFYTKDTLAGSIKE